MMCLLIGILKILNGDIKRDNLLIDQEKDSDTELR